MPAHGSGGRGWPWHRIGTYGENMARWDPGSDRRPACSACAADQIYVRGRIRRAVVRVGFCRRARTTAERLLTDRLPGPL